MKLVDLNPTWIGAGGEGVTRNGQPVPERHGIGVGCDCPCGADGCWLAVYFSNPLDGLPPDPFYVPHHVWDRTGDTFETLTLRPSIQRADPDGCRWHGFLTNGEFVAC